MSEVKVYSVADIGKLADDGELVSAKVPAVSVEMALFHASATTGLKGKDLMVTFESDKNGSFVAHDITLGVDIYRAIRAFDGDPEEGVDFLAQAAGASEGRVWETLELIWISPPTLGPMEQLMIDFKTVLNEWASESQLYREFAGGSEVAALPEDLTWDSLGSWVSANSISGEHKISMLLEIGIAYGRKTEGGAEMSEIFQELAMLDQCLTDYSEIPF